MAFTKEDLAPIVETVGKEVADKLKLHSEQVEKTINEKLGDVNKGVMKAEEFEKFKTETIAPLNELLEKVDKANIEIGNKVQTLIKTAAPNSKSLTEFLTEKKDEIKALHKSKSYIEITGQELKAAGVYSIAGAIPTPSAYAPGLNNGDLVIYDVARNPDFITSKVNMGNTNNALLAWANELETIQGGAGKVNEGALKPQAQHQWSIQMSTAQKIAEWSELTEEFETDLPGFATKVQRLMQQDTYRAFDDAVQVDVQSKAKPFTIAGLNGKIAFANYWDALNALGAQVGSYNYIPNGIGYNYITKAIVEGQKTTQGEYLLPTFADKMLAMTSYANKMADYYALVGDLKQYNVDIYKDIVIRIGWINDEFVNNKFAIVCEMRYHSYIADARTKALAYDSLDTVVTAIGV